MSSALSPRRMSGSVMASIDGDDEEERLIIADVTKDEAWIAVPLSEAPSLSQWR